MKKSRISAIVKATTKCNSNCLYCYENKKDVNMDNKTLKNTIKKILDFNGKEVLSEFIWHGGEPLLRRKEFFKKILDYQNFYANNHFIENKIQTNATLVTEDLADFFNRNNFKIGISLDGREENHNFTRPLIEKRNSLEETLKGIEILKNRNILFGGICVVTKNNLYDLKKNYDFFNQLDIPMKLLPLFKTGEAKKNLSSLEISQNDYADEMIRLFDYWWESKSESVLIDPFEPMIQNLISGKPIGCIYRSDCADNYISINPNGDVYPCGRLSGYKEFYMGNINNHSIEFLQKTKVKEIIRNRNVRYCNPCEYKENCNSDCVLSSYLNGGDINSKPSFCYSNKKLFSHIKNKILEDLLSPTPSQSFEL